MAPKQVELNTELGFKIGKEASNVHNLLMYRNAKGHFLYL